MSVALHSALSFEFRVTKLSPNGLQVNSTDVKIFKPPNPNPNPVQTQLRDTSANLFLFEEPH